MNSLRHKVRNLSLLPVTADVWEYPRSIILEVTDADTFRAQVDQGLDTYRNITLRLADCDAPEIRLYEGVTEAEKTAGLYMRDALRERLTDEPCVIQTIKDRREKYGRYLANVFHDGEWINEWVRIETQKWLDRQ